MALALIDDFRAPTGRFELWVRRNGVLVEHVDEPNLIVNGSRNLHALLIGGTVSNNSVTQIGYGTGTAAPAVGNSGLTAQFAKALDSVTFPATNQVAFNFSLLTSEDNGALISEFGLLTAGGALYARKVRSAPLTKNSSLSFTGTWTIAF